MAQREIMPVKPASLVYSLIGASAAVYAAVTLLLFPKWTVDSAYIVFRYARNFAEQGQLTWNPGQSPIEGYTGVGLVLLLSLTTRLGISPVGTSQATGAISFLVGGLVFVYFLRRLQLAWSVTAIGTLLYFTAPFFVTNALSGLETVLFSTVALASLCALYNCLAMPSPSPASETALFTLLLLVGLIRPEGAVLGTECLAVLAVMTRRDPTQVRWRRLINVILIYVAPGCIYFVWRWSYYGLLLPNTFYVTSAGQGTLGLLPNLESVLQVREFSVSYGLLPLACAVMWTIADTDAVKDDLRQRDRSAARLVTGAVAVVFVIVCALFYARSQLVMNFSYRFFLPFFPMLLIVMAVLADAGVRTVSAARTEKPLRFQFLAALSVILVLVQLLLYCRELRREFTYVSWYMRLLEDEHVAAGKFIRHHVPPTEWLIVEDAGAIPYYSGLPTVDLSGLNDPNVLRFLRSNNLRALVDYFYSFKPGVAVFTSYDRERVVNTDPLSTAILGDERFQAYVQVRRFSTSGRDYHQFVFFRRDLAAPTP
jgi:hypothetical protein